MNNYTQTMRSLAALLTVSVAVTVLAQTPPAGGIAAPATAKAVFAGGCFWCVESDFDKVLGVLSTTSGYTGGRTFNPTYQQVSSNNTGHAEVVEIVLDPAKVSYEPLVEHFWHTPLPKISSSVTGAALAAARFSRSMPRNSKLHRYLKRH